jgi:hybrid polyketide synthase/nonribosomal peptide synthetase FtdB
MPSEDVVRDDNRIAIVGIGCRLPGGANDHRQYWRNLVEGRDCITPVPENRYDLATLLSGDKTKPGRMVGGRGGYIDGFDEFDPEFFGISPREASYLDPQQRKLLEVTWEALEDGGQRPWELAGTNVGVFIGAFTLDYMILQYADLGFDEIAAHTAIGTMMTMVSNRISHSFDFRGPSLSVDTACSSSLVAVHLACQSLLRGETELALAGGTLLHMAPQYTIAETKGGFLSSDGRSRTFDAGANGYVRAEGVGVVALKTLSQAVQDGDPVYAVILGSGVNQDGRTNGITVPNPDAQFSLITQVCADAGITPGDLQYVEAHGTSTPVGDPIEAKAIGRALAVGRRRGDRCYVGSVKTNIGHTEAAAGVAGLIKTALILRNRTIPPHINLERINPDIDLDALPFEIPTAVTAWPDNGRPARAGVNAFGFGGTNAHIVLEEQPRVVEAAPEQVETASGANDNPRYSILPLSAHDPEALHRVVDNIRRELTGEDGHRPPALVDLGYTLARRRQHLANRLSVVYTPTDDVAAMLAGYLDGASSPRVVRDEGRDPQSRRLMWVFTGMGPQWWAMGRELFDTEPVYREMIERCDEEIRQLAGWSLIDELNVDEERSNMKETWLAQPANFAVQAGLAALWHSWGVHPDAVVGHSTGEIAAFFEAGVYTFSDAVLVAIHRSRLQQRLVGSGGMLAVGLSGKEAAERIGPWADKVSVAAENSPTSVTLAGDFAALDEIADTLRNEQIFVKPLEVLVPYHSPGMDLIKDELISSLSPLDPRPAQIPLYLTGRTGTAHGTELDGRYWWHNVRDTVRFRDAVDCAVDDGFTTFLEIGPHPVLGHAIRECLEHKGVAGRTVASIRRKAGERERMTISLAELHNLGVPIDWSQVHPRGRVVSLPPYPWKRQRYWAESARVEQVRRGRIDHVLLGRRTSHADPTWETRLDPETLPYLEDHQIQGQVIFPAAGYLEMAAQAVRSLTGGAVAALTDIELRHALFLTGHDTRRVRLTVSASDASFSIVSSERGFTVAPGPEPVVHVSGVIRAGQRRRDTSVLDPDSVRGRAVRHADKGACYAELADLGYEYGPAFQGIDEVWSSPSEALALVRPPAAIGADAAEYHLHPVLLDACFQSLLTTLRADQSARHGSDDGQGGMLLPVSIDEVTIEPVGDRPLWAHATVTRHNDDELVGDIRLYTQDGQPIGIVRGLRTANVERSTATAGRATIESMLAEVTWVNCGSRPPIEERQLPDLTGGRWLLFADRSGVGEALATQIRALGGTCHTVVAGTGYRRNNDAVESMVGPGSWADLEQLLADFPAEWNRTFDAIVHLWNLDLPHDPASVAGDDIGQYGELGCRSLSTVARAMDQEGLTGRLHVVTRATQKVIEGDDPGPLGAAAWGLCRVLWYQELAGRCGKIIDLDHLTPATPDGNSLAAADILREIVTGTDDEVAIRGDDRFTSRLVPLSGLTGPLPLRLRTDGSYLITGAFGALGRLVCRLLARRGARRLILMGRTIPPSRAEWPTVVPDCAAGRSIALIRELETLGVQVTPAAVDVTDEKALAGWLASHRAESGLPIRGVFHLAGQASDTLVPDMTRELFDAAYLPKVAGSLLLHRLLSDEPLDHFVLFSSIASLIITAGQTNYAAGNAFLDALAHHRREHGLPGLSIDWGPWATGMIEELGLVDHYRNSRGMSSLAPETGMSILERVVGVDHAQIAVTTVVDWRTFRAWYTALPPLLSELSAGAEAAPTGDGTSLVDVFRETPDDQRLAFALEHFTALVTSTLRVESDRVAPAVGLNALGLDSLLAMELRARLNAELGIVIPVVSLLSGTTVAELAQQVHDGLVAQLDDSPATERDAGAFEMWENEEEYPLTQNQQALWFLKQLDPEGFAYNIGGALEVRTELDPDLFFEAFRTVVARHPSLRANVVLSEGRPVQRISPEVRADVAVFDVGDWEWQQIYQKIIEEYRRPYDLERDSLVRLRLFRRASDRWIIVKAVHHVVSDAISTFTFIEEIFARYEGMRRGQLVELPAVPARYLDFLNHQNRFLASPDSERMLRYWRDHLPEKITALDLPTDRPRPDVRTHNGSSAFFQLDGELTSRVHDMARDTDSTIFVVLMAAYYLLLHRYSGQDDLIIGSPVTGRTREEFSATYGYFVNPLPLHVSLASNPTVAELIDRVRTTILNGLDNQEYPFVLLVDELGLPQDPSRSAVFQVMFILLTHKVTTEQYGYRLEYIELPEEEGQFDLTLSVYEDAAEGSFHCVFKYNSDLFLPETVQRFARHFTTLVDALTRTSSQCRIDALDMLDPKEYATVVDGWSGRRQLGDPGPSIPEMILEQAGRSPDTVAVCAPAADGTVRRTSYRELAAQSARVASRLKALGIGAGATVALCMHKSPELLSTLVGVMRSGAAYLPLDPEYPARRLEYMIQNADVAVVVSDSPLDAVVSGSGRLVVSAHDLLDGATAVDEPEGQSTTGGLSPDSPAYVIYTSGTTGQPKAVQVTHHSLASAYRSWNEIYRLDGEIRVHLQMASFAFDVFTGDLVRALCSGGTLVLVERNILLDPAALYQTMLTEGVHAGEFVPAIARALTTYCYREGKRLDFLRLVIVGSDAWRVDEYQRLARLCGPETRLVNSYGVTEATIDNTWFEGALDAAVPGQMVPIGRPLPNSEVYVLDRGRRPVPPGVPGELWIGGEATAAGYLNDPEQSAERFAQLDLGHGRPPVRAYRTGDLVRWDHTGCLHLIGRGDTQVKVRGHRIETGEVEKHLTRFPGISGAVVTVRPDGGGDNTLCGYYVSADEGPADNGAIRRHLADHLPAYMVPAHLTRLSGFPLTPNGKIDVAALPEPVSSPRSEETHPPTTMFEVSLAEMWRSVLGLPAVGLHDDFFEVGGSSIKLIELIYHVRMAFGVEAPVASLLLASTLHGMARTVELIATGKSVSVTPFLRFNPQCPDPLFCFPPAGGHGLVYRQFAACLPQVELVALNHLGGDDRVARYADLIERHRPEGPLRLLGYSLGGNLAFEVAGELENRGRRVPVVIIMDSLRIAEPFALGEQGLAVFAQELGEHLRRHTGSEIVALETLEQAKDYIDFCGRTPNTRTVKARVVVLTEEGRVARYRSGTPGSWERSSATRTDLISGFGSHVEMLDQPSVVSNAQVVAAILTEDGPLPAAGAGAGIDAIDSAGVTR